MATFHLELFSSFVLHTINVTGLQQNIVELPRCQEVLTTRTDYVNKHPSIIQTTSYNFTVASNAYVMLASSQITLI